MARDHHHDRVVCRDGSSVHTGLKAGPDHFDLGTEGRRTFTIESCHIRSRGGNRGRSPLTAIYGLFETPHAAQRAFDGLRAVGVAISDITVMSSEPLEEWEFSSQ